MFLLTKILPLLVLPLGLALLLLLWGVLRGSRWPAAAALPLLAFFSTPLTGEALWRWLEWPHQHLNPGDDADSRLRLLLEPMEGGRLAAQHVDQDVGVQQQHQCPAHSWRSTSCIARASSAREIPR
ncbi:hypothetical protein [Synechococcus sp. CCY9202]|uniref:hypothetical protein n=1 Tax=Synechococcus sp. CCY9202 TaxID=174698 RepID=UPI002B1FFC0B|nr:hypothetical protein [Synechococcus sp. CCY9202]MEA5423753.1 hypothetical protein [Synechococcus sp. CCY9202]